MATTIINQATSGTTAAIDLLVTETSTTDAWVLTGSVGSDQDTLSFEVSSDAGVTYVVLPDLVDGKIVPIVLTAVRNSDDTFDGDFSFSIAGAYTNIRAVKTGTSGTAFANINGN